LIDKQNFAISFQEQDNPWLDLQRSKVVHGDEPEAVRRLHAEIQDRAEEGARKESAEDRGLAEDRVQSEEQSGH